MRATNSCIDCHTAGGTESVYPFADSDVDRAYAAAKANSLVDFDKPDTSKVLTYLNNNHCSSTECNVTDPAIVGRFKKAAEDWAAAENTPDASSSPTPPANALSSLPGVYTDNVQIPATVPLSPAAPTKFSVPLARLGAAFTGTSLRFDLVYLVSMQDSNGATIYLYQLSNPVLVNQGSSTVSIGTIDVGLDGLYDPQNRIFSSSSFAATAAPGASVSLNPADTARAMIFWGHGGSGQNQIAVNCGTHNP
jgi:hypothetical protein